MGTQLEFTVTTWSSVHRVRWWCSGAGVLTSTWCCKMTGPGGRRYINT